MTRYNDNLISFFRTYRLFWITVCSLFLLNAAFYGIFIQGQKEKIENLQQRFARLRRQSMPGGTQKSDIETLTAARNELIEFRNTLPERKAFSNQVGELYRVLNRYPVAVGKIDFKPERDEKLMLWRYRSNLSIRGAYPLLRKILADIQNMDNLLAIEDVSIRSGRGNQSEPEMKLKISIYLT